jgi:hypothetical protein
MLPAVSSSAVKVSAKLLVMGLVAAACDLDGRALDVVGPAKVVEAGPTTPDSRSPDSMDTGTGTSPADACEGCNTTDECAALAANAPCTVNGRAGECSASGCRDRRRHETGASELRGGSHTHQGLGRASAARLFPAARVAGLHSHRGGPRSAHFGGKRRTGIAWLFFGCDAATVA